MMTKKIESAYEAIADKLKEVRQIECRLTRVIEHELSQMHVSPQVKGDFIVLIQQRCRALFRLELKDVYNVYTATAVEAYKRHGSPYEVELDFVVTEKHH